MLDGLKTQAQREEERKSSLLPILTKRNEFVRALLDNYVVIAVAETGSGKTTQLPQYCAESPEFRGQVICTQPRAVAASSIGDRVAKEFDGTSAG